MTIWLLWGNFHLKVKTNPRAVNRTLWEEREAPSIVMMKAQRSR